MQEQSETTTVQTTTAQAASPESYTQKKTIFRIYQVIWYILGIMEALLIARFVFKVLGANSSTSFVNFIYTLSAPLAAPFRGIFPTPQVEGSVFEWYTLVACVVYAIVAYGLVQLFQLVKPTDPVEVEEKVS